MTTIDSFIKRLDRLGIKVELSCNYPWVYLDSISGKRVKEKYNSEWGFTICMKAIRVGQQDQWTDIRLIFKTIRQYL